MRWFWTIGAVASLGMLVALCTPSAFLSDSQKMTIFLSAFGTGALTGAVRTALGIWLPRFRGYWGGPFTGHASRGDPDRMSLGRVSHTGGTILCTGFASAAFFSLLSGPTLNSVHIGLVPSLIFACIFSGFFLLMVGWLLDCRAHDAARHGPRLPGGPWIRPEERHRWVAVAGGILILLVIIWLLIFLK